MVSTLEHFQWVARRRVQYMFMFRSNAFALRRGYLGALAEIGFLGALGFYRGRENDSG